MTMNVSTVYGATEVIWMPSIQLELRGAVFLSWNTKEKVRNRLEAEIIAGRVLANCRR